MANGEADRSALPGVAFAFHFSNQDGFVQRFFAHQRDLVARELRGTARCLLAFKEVRANPAFSPQWSEEAQADFYDYSPRNRTYLRQFLHDNRIELVIFQGAYLGEVDVTLFRDLRVKTINTEDGSFDHASAQSLGHAAAKILLRRVLKRNIHDLHIANTQGQHDFLRSFAHLPPQRLKIVRYGIDTEYYSPGDRVAACAQLGLDPETIWIMAASQARPEKRVGSLIEAVRRVKEARPGVPIGFFYVGDGVLLTDWQELARRLPSAGDYRFFGKQSDMRPFYRAASIFIHGASKESFGLVLAEAMASGLPVVATRAHGPAEIIDDGRTGVLIERDDWDGFVRAILAYVDQPEVRRSHGENGRRKCLELYTSDRQATELAGLIRPFLAQASRGRIGGGEP